MSLSSPFPSTHTCPAAIGRFAAVNASVKVVAAPVIDCVGLTRMFRTYRKRPGLLGAMRDLLQRRYDATYAARDVTFRVDAGEFVGFLGPNGAGKTTVLKMLAGLMHPTEGRATVLGYVPWQRHYDYRRQFALLLGQKNQLWWDLAAIDSLELNARIYGIDRADFQARLKELTGLLRVEDKLNIMVRELSLGERMKMELIAALLHRPRVLFLDEPTIGLDVVSQSTVRDFLREHNRLHGTTIILTSHYMADIEALCDRVVIMDRGRIFFDGAFAEVMRKYAAFKVVTLTCSPPARIEDVPARVRALAEPLWSETLGLQLKVSRDKVPALCRALLDHYNVIDMAIDDISAEEVIRELFISEERARLAG